MKLSRLSTAAALCVCLMSAHAAQALPAAGLASRPAAAVSEGGASALQNVYYRGHRGGYWRGGRWVGLGIASAIVGSAIIADEGYRYRRYRYSGDGARQQCADRFRSFDWDSGTYMGYDGERHVCPYL